MLKNNLTPFFTVCSLVRHIKLLSVVELSLCFFFFIFFFFNLTTRFSSRRLQIFMAFKDISDKIHLLYYFVFKQPHFFFILFSVIYKLIAIYRHLCLYIKMNAHTVQSHSPCINSFAQRARQVILVQFGNRSCV